MQLHSNFGTDEGAVRWPNLCHSTGQIDSTVTRPSLGKTRVPGGQGLKKTLSEGQRCNSWRQLSEQEQEQAWDPINWGNIAIAEAEGILLLPSAGYATAPST